GRGVKKNELIHPTNMNLKAGFGLKQLELMDTIRKAAKERGEEIYLFGGAVRDCMLLRPIHDLDFIINGDAIEFAEYLKNKHGNIFKDTFLKPSVKRAVIYTKDMEIDIKPLCEDCKTVTGQDNIRKALIRNLRDNDFSVNSMIIKLDEDKYGKMKLKFRDYLGGREDLSQNKLRHNNREAFMADPIKALRGLRLKLEYGMKIQSDTSKLIKENLKNPKVKKNKFYYRYTRECLRIVKEFFKRLF
ncbi:hypothetical protein IKQ21_05945, partial [bacterium]|nr:hypothetical protein [bacterium]